MSEPHHPLIAPGDAQGPLITQAPSWFTQAIAVEPEVRAIEVQGTRIEYLRWGNPEKPGLLLSHGNGAHARWWSFIAPFLAREYSVAAVNTSGMGDSGWRDKYTIEIFAEEQIAVCEDAGFFKGTSRPLSSVIPLAVSSRS